MLDPLLVAAGSWRGTNELFLSEDQPPDPSASTLLVTPILSGTFVRIDQTWEYKGVTQFGSALVGFDPALQQATVHWIDTFHNGRRVLPCVGIGGGHGPINVRGSYPAPPGPDWGWRIVIDAGDGHPALSMYSIDPAGNEALAVRATYFRA